MKKILLVVAILMSTTTFANRPDAVQEAVDVRFEKQFKAKTNDINDKDSYWHADYYLGEYKVVKSIINAAPQAQKHFYFLDLNARNGSWAKEISKLIDQDEEVAEDIEITFYSVNEENGHIKVSETDKCYLIEVNGFKIENFDTAFADMTGDEDILLDYVRQDPMLENAKNQSQKLFRALVDPLGTCVQIFKNMRKGALANLRPFYIMPGYQNQQIFCDKARIKTFSVNRILYFLKLENIELPWTYKSELSDLGQAQLNVPTFDIIKSQKEWLSNERTDLETDKNDFVQSLTELIRAQTTVQQAGAAGADHD